MPRKKVLITGVSSGMGKAVAFALHEKGYEVFGTSRNPEKWKDFPFPVLPLDLADSHSIRQFQGELKKHTPSLDILINNAGRGFIGPVEETSEEEMKTLFETNFFGPVKLIQKLLPLLRKSGSGMIINISSVAGFLGLPYRSFYSASKAALMMLSESLRYELHGSGIRVVDVAPGDFATEISKGRIYVENRPGSPYYETYQRILKDIDKEVSKGLPPEAMAKLILKIIQKNNPKPQYIIGPFEQKILPLVKALIPGKWFEKIILKNYKLK